MNNFSPEQIKAFQQQFQNCTPEQIQAMLKNMGPQQKLQAAQMGMSPEMLEQQLKMLSENPDLIRKTQEEMKNMTPEQIAATIPGASMQQPSSSGSTPRASTPTGTPLKGKLGKIEKIKNDGNEFFRKQQYTEAIEKYEEALGELANESLGNKNEDAWALKSTCHLNMATCLSKLGQHNRVLRECGEVLSQGPNRKALFRRGHSNMELGKLAEARRDLKQALSLDPSDGVVRSAYEQLQQKIKESGKDIPDDAEGASGTAVAETEQNFSEMSVGQLRKYLEARGVDYKSVVDKHELVELARKHSSTPATTTVTPKSSPSPAPSTTISSTASPMGGFGGFDPNMDPVQMKAQIQAQRNMIRSNPSMFLAQMRTQPGMQNVTIEQLESQFDMLLGMEPEALASTLKMQHQMQQAGYGARPGEQPKVPPPEVINNMDPKVMLNAMKAQQAALKANPAMFEQLQAQNPQMAGMTREQVEAQLDMMCAMSPEQLKNMLQMQQQMQGGSSSPAPSAAEPVASTSSPRAKDKKGGSSGTQPAPASAAAPPMPSPDMNPADLMNNMTPEQMSNMIKMQRDMLKANPNLYETMVQGNPAFAGMSREQVIQQLDSMADMAPATLHRLMMTSQKVQQGSEAVRGMWQAVDRRLGGHLWSVVMAVLAWLVLYVLDMLYARYFR
eukprot:comp17577_c0_seq1/m.17201 comp17577_c0_seq1/g.17201  ORF comp17577_c0_seq1/g.17201 comp17577_c0_seq1/m.17201 type:complete len:671 (-) comp17577_c0_seq1:237-2249(-)